VNTHQTTFVFVAAALFALALGAAALVNRLAALFDAVAA